MQELRFPPPIRTTTSWAAHSQCPKIQVQREIPHQKTIGTIRSHRGSEVVGRDESLTGRKNMV